MWVIVQSRDDKKQIVSGVLDHEPLDEDDDGFKLKVGSPVVVRYDKVREHRKRSEFKTR